MQTLRLIGLWHLSLALVFFPLFLSAQEDCHEAPEGKAVKVFEQSQDKKKNDADKRRDLLEKSVELDESCLPCRLALGTSLFKNAKRVRGSFSQAAVQFAWIVDHCPEYHADPYYYLGAINYANQEYAAALQYFEEFKDFEAGAPAQKGKKFDEKLKVVNKAMPQVAFYRDFYKEEIKILPNPISGVSTQSDEYLPALSPDNELIFYTRVSEKKALGDVVSQKIEELTVSKRPDWRTDFDGGEALEKPFNMGSNYGGVTVSVDNKEMYVAAKNPVPENKQNIDLYRASWEEYYDESSKTSRYRWGKLELLGPHINGPKSWESQPSLSADGQTLFFATIREGCVPNGSGDPSTDIYYCERNDDGTWGSATNAGEIINTAGNDKAPFIHSDSKTLYFASSGHLGIGGYDLFYARQDDLGNWLLPKNIGYPVNTDNDEHGMIVSADGALAYFASRRMKNSRSFDIYAFEMPEKAKPEKVMILKGKLSNDSGEIPQNAKVELKYVESNEVQEIKVDELDGRYAAVVNVERNENVVVAVKGDGIAFNAKTVVKKDDPKPAVVSKMVNRVEKLSKNKAFVIEDIFYETNSSEISQSSKILLSEFAEYLNKNTSIVIEIRGHTDDVGADTDNLALSMDRAFSVKGYLEKMGIAGRRISAMGYGEKQPVVPNTSEENRAQNRRTEFVVKTM